MEKGDENTVEISFENGTVTVKSKEETTALLGEFKALCWDKRTSCFRAPANVWIEIRKSLLQKNFLLRDRVAPGLKKQDFQLNLPPLRTHQSQALEAWEVRGCRKGIVCLPTGAGKTILSLHALKRAGVPTLILVPTLVLQEQWKQGLEKSQAGKVGVIGNGDFDLQPITVSTFRSAFLRAAEIGLRFGLLIVDEVHHFGGGEMDELFLMYVAPWRLGLTATPLEDTDQVTKISNLIGPVVSRAGMGSLLGNVLSDFRESFVPFKPNLESLKKHQLCRKIWETYKDDLLQKGHLREDLFRNAQRTAEGRKALACLKESRGVLYECEERVTKIAEILEGLKTDASRNLNRALIFAPDTASSYRLAHRLRIPTITSQIPSLERKAYLEAFASGHLRALISCRVLNEGYDLPEADVCLIVAPFQHKRDLIQRVGRVLRKKELKTARVIFCIAQGTHEVVEVGRCQAILRAERKKA